MPAALQNLIGNASAKMDPNQPNGGQTPPTPTVPAGLQPGNTSSSVMQWLSGKFGGGDPAQEQNNTYMKGKVDEYMANQAAVKARAQQKGAAAAARELKKGQATLTPPVQATPGTGQTATTPLQQLWQSVQSGLGMK
jgi:hypothetical protein